MEVSATAACVHVADWNFGVPKDIAVRQSRGKCPPRNPRACHAQGKSDGASRAFVGLLVHSAADGFAVGAACVGGSSALSGAIALAMVLHKARPCRPLLGA